MTAPLTALEQMLVEEIVSASVHGSELLAIWYFL